jgi:hypothetical protein
MTAMMNYSECLNHSTQPSAFDAEMLLQSATEHAGAPNLAETMGPSVERVHGL